MEDLNFRFFSYVRTIVKNGRLELFDWFIVVVGNFTHAVSWAHYKKVTMRYSSNNLIFRYISLVLCGIISFSS